MKTVLIIDDEPNVVQGLGEDIDWDELGIDQVYEATNGEEAKAVLESGRIDIIISDIRMPLLDGLSLARIVRERWPLCRLIILSGYDLFSYAQKAVEYRVFRYLSKPAPYGEIVEAVKEALADQEKQVRRLRSLQDAELRLEQVLPLLQSNLLKGMVINDEEITPEQWVLLKQNIPYIGRDAAVFQVFIRNGGRSLPDLEWIKSSLLEEESLGFELVYMTLPLEDSHILLSLWEAPGPAERALKRLEQLCDLLFPDLEEDDGLLLFSPVHTLCEAGDYYISLLERKGRAAGLSGERIILSNAWNGRALPPHQTVLNAKRFIEKNIAGECTIQEVADSVKIHAGYLSRLFRQTENMSLQNYIIARRIELAARMLREPGARVYHVAEQVGYGSPYHFSRMFKRIKGISPKEYQIHNS